MALALQVAKTLTYSVIYERPLFVALCDHNPPITQTVGCHSCNIVSDTTTCNLVEWTKYFV